MKARVSTIVLILLVSSVRAVGQAPDQSGQARQAIASDRLSLIESNQRLLLDQVRAIQANLADLAERLTAAPPPAPPSLDKTFSLDALPTKGAEDAPVIVVEYADFECPYCRAFERQTFPQLREHYIATGRVRWAFANLPLSAIHPDALHAAEAAECARRQGHFWEMHDALFADQAHLDQVALVASAKAIGLDMSAFSSCVQAEGTETIAAALDFARSRRISVTPTFVVGVLQGSGSVQPVRTITGAADYASFRTILDQLLGGQNQAGGK